MNTGGEEKPEASTSSGEDGVKGSQLEKEKAKDDTKTVPFYKLFAFADLTDYVLMIVGTIGAVGNGICMPLMTILFGDLLNSFGQNQNNDDVVSVVSKVCCTKFTAFLHYFDTIIAYQLSIINYLTRWRCVTGISEICLSGCWLWYRIISP